MQSYPRDTWTVEEKRLRSRHPSLLMQYSGVTEEVWLAVAAVLARDAHTPHYDHMRARITQIDTSVPGRLTVQVYKNLYAGD